MAFQVSTAKVDITPPAGMNPYMGGYGVQSGLRTVVSDRPHSTPLYARCVIMWDGGNPNALISLDVLGLTREVHRSVRPRLVPLATWQSSDIVITATHTHNAPALGDLDPFIAYGLSALDPIDTYAAWLQDRIVEVVATALAAGRTAVTLDYKVVSAGFAHNRAGLTTTETAVPILAARARDGSRAAVIFSYGCHAVSAGWQEEWDGDWPAGACEVIERATGGFALFLPGPFGDQDPDGLRGWALRDEHAHTLGETVVAATTTPGRVLSGPIGSSIRDVTLPLDLTPTAANLAAVRAAYVTRMANPHGYPAWYVRHAEEMIARLDSGSFETAVINPSQVWRIGGSPMLRMAFVGGELVSGYGAYFRARYGGPAGLYIGGNGNECTCYVPANNMLPPLAAPYGSYEGGWDTDFPGLAGGSMTVYPHIGHFKAGSSGVESATIAALVSQLA